ncbi:MAG: hypothetical protein EOO88_29450 [Pedobacter sp.]|nr:MAG: hypothetical protein EOO88_29450 [Pedobacter sp.]
MVKVKFLEPLFAEQTKTHYLKGAEVKIPKDLAERHGPEGTGLLEILEDQGDEKPAPVKVKKDK